MKKTNILALILMLAASQLPHARGAECRKNQQEIHSLPEDLVHKILSDKLTEADVKEISPIFINATHGKGKFTMLHHAVENRHKGLVQALLEKGANPNQPDACGNTPTQSAVPRVGKCNIEILDLLLKHGGNAEATDKLGESLYSIALDRHPLPVQALILRCLLNAKQTREINN
ncbi:MAG: ankyrin repeat domain-containing protein [Epsilonproteobacteria bacterium]|nr:ankyrin repeat domain-containing protein [Campylobacterota bacterium]